MPGTLFVVSTPIGNLEDLTLRALRTLREVRVIAAEDTRRTRQLLARYDIKTRTVSLHEHNERARTPALLARLHEGDDVALVTDAGTPLLSDPGSHLVGQALEAGIRVVPIPGPSAVLAALVGSGFSCATFTFLGFPPVKPSARSEWFHSLAAEPRTAVFFEAPHRIRATLAELADAIGDRPIAVCREMTKIHETWERGTASAISARVGPAVRGELTIVVSPPAESSPAVVEVGDEEVRTEFDRMTEAGMGRRAAVAAVARKFGLAGRAAYAAIERGKATRSRPPGEP